jgi:phage-related minor tail protein
MTQDQNDALDALGDGADALNDSLAGAANMAAGFDSELRRVKDAFAATGRDAAKMETSLSRGLGKALEGVTFDGVRLSDAMQGLAASMARTGYSAATKPVTEALGGSIADGVGRIFSGILPFADGASFAQGRVMPFAKGGVVAGPTTFPMRGGTGLMGEAGPEAIMPLTRTPDGKLGVRSAAGGSAPVRVVMNIQTPDADSFRRSQGQIAAAMGRALSRGHKNR